MDITLNGAINIKMNIHKLATIAKWIGAGKAGKRECNRSK
jgi:hypothetical protein